MLPGFRRTAQGMSADERELRRQTERRLHDGALGAADVGDDSRLRHVVVELGQQLDVLLHRRREDDQVRFREDVRIVGGDVNRMEPHRRLEDILVVDADHDRRRPDLARGQRDRSADQAEPDDADLGTNRRLSRALVQLAGLDDR